MPDSEKAPAPAQGGDAPAASSAKEAPAPTPELKTFEAWGTVKLGVVFDAETGRASAVQKGRRVAKISSAALVNAVRPEVPIGKRMSAAEFDALIAKARSISISIS